MYKFAVQPVEYLLPLSHSEVDGVEVGHHEGGLEEVVEADDHRQDHVGNIDIPAEQDYHCLFSYSWGHGPPGCEENDEVCVVSDSEELLDGGEDEDVAHDEAGAGLAGELRREVGYSAGQQQEGADYHLREQDVPAVR